MINKIITKKDWRNFVQTNLYINEILKKILSDASISMYKSIRKLENSTNAVYEIDNYIVKIYAIAEQEYNPYMDWLREKFLISMLNDSNYIIPKIVYSGYIIDGYKFYYIIFEKLTNILPLNQILANSSSQLYRWLLEELKSVINTIHTLPVNKIYVQKYSKLQCATKAQYWGNDYEKFFSEYLLEHQPEFGLVHTDISENNIFITNNNELAIIDFEDWMYASIEASYPIITFELLKKPHIIRDFFNSQSPSELVETLIVGILMHHNSLYFIKHFNEYTDEKYSFFNIPSLKTLYNYLYLWLYH